MDASERRGLLRGYMTTATELEHRTEMLEDELMQLSQAVFGDKPLGVKSMNDRLKSIELFLVVIGLGLFANSIGTAIVLVKLFFF